MLSAALGDHELIDRVSGHAHAFVREHLGMAESAALSLGMASDLARRVPAARSSLPAPSTLATDQLPMAQWVPSVRPLPGGQPDRGQPDRGQAALLRSLNGLRRRQAVTRVESRSRSGHVAVDVLCTRRAGDGPFAALSPGLARQRAEVAVHLGSDQPSDEHQAHPGVATSASWTEPIGRGRMRNAVLS